MEGVHLVKSDFSRRKMLQVMGAAALSASVSHSLALSSMDARDIASIPGVPRIAIEISGVGTLPSAANVDETAMRRVTQLGVVVSEYGYCACTQDRPEGDEKRMEILRTHQDAIRSREFVSGAIFFCYNDYRTHVGDRGLGAYRQRVHGVVDLNGTRKTSYELLRLESSPIESLTVKLSGNKLEVQIKTRRDFPMYTLKSYTLRGIFFGQGNIAVEQQEVNLPNLAPGSETMRELTFSVPESPIRVRIDVLRPTGFSAGSQDWRP